MMDIFGGKSPAELAAQVYQSAPGMDPTPLLGAIDQWQNKKMSMMAGNGSPMSFELAKGQPTWEMNADRWLDQYGPKPKGPIPIGQMLAGAQMGGQRPPLQPPPFVDPSGTVGQAQPSKLMFEMPPPVNAQMPSLGQLFMRARNG